MRDGEVIDKAVASKQLAIHALPAGGTQEQAIEPERQDEPALTDAQAVQLAQLGRRIEAHFGRPRTLNGASSMTASRSSRAGRSPRTLFPIPSVGNEEKHVSVGHQQMMTGPIKPLGLSVWQLTAFRPMYHAGGRLFIDVIQDLASPASRGALLEGLGRSDPLIGAALQIILHRGDFMPTIPDQAPGGPPAGGAPAPIETDPAIVTELIKRSEASIAALN
ncbi:hypothetical protein BH23PLA1_BH23PLA1_42780 [soil metagenome]